MTVFRGQNREREREKSLALRRGFEWSKTAASEIEGRVLYKHVRPTKQVDVVSVFLPFSASPVFFLPTKWGRAIVQGFSR